MTPNALKALKGSIRKWEKIVSGEGEDWGTENCPLCVAFVSKNCRGCPVMRTTGQRECRGSPYMNDWAKLGFPDKAVSDEQMVAAVKELRFLKSLLPTAQ